MNVDEAIAYASKDKCFWTGEVHTALETLAAEVERLRGELAIYTSPKRMVIKKLPWMCGNCGEQTVDCIRPYTGSDGESLLGTCSNCGSEWVS